MSEMLKLRADLPDELPVHSQDIDIVQVDGWQVRVATVRSEFLEPQEVNRRALLLAAAPDLLAALEMALAQTGGWISAAHYAIAKARGEGVTA